MRNGQARAMPPTRPLCPGAARIDEESTMVRGMRTRYRGRRLRMVLAALVPLAVAARVDASAGDTTADRVLGQVDFVHSTFPSFVRARSLDLEGDPRGNGIAIDVAHSPSAIY